MPTAPSSSSKSLYCNCSYLCCFLLWVPPGFWFISAQCWGLVRKWGQGCRFGLRSTCNSQKFNFSLEMNWNLQLMTNLSNLSWHFFFWLCVSTCSILQNWLTRLNGKQYMIQLNRQKVVHLHFTERCTEVMYVILSWRWLWIKWCSLKFNFL